MSCVALINDDDLDGNDEVVGDTATVFDVFDAASADLVACLVSLLMLMLLGTRCAEEVELMVLKQQRATTGKR
jgi:hypothetical protein